MPHPTDRPIPAADAAAVRARLTPSRSRLDVRVYDTLDSTNAEAKRWAMAHPESTHPVLILARAQTEGRGRLGRSFYSPAHSGLYMTLLFTPHRPLEEAVRITGAAAVAVVRAVEALTPKRPAVKWVNDLYLDGAKLAGILAEGILPPDGPPRIAVGVGINLTTRAFPEGLRAPATSLAAEGEPAPDINALAARIAEELLDAAEGNPCAPDRLADYRRRCYLTGKAVVCTRGDTRLEGVAEGIGDDYALLIRTPTGELIRVTEGEATVRVAEG